MKINLDIDEGKIIRDIMSGFSKKNVIDDIKDEIITEVKKRIINCAMKDAQNFMDSITQEVQKSYQEGLKNTIVEKIQKELSIKKLKRLFNKGGIQWFEDALEKTIGEWISYALEEWINLQISVGTGKSKKIVTMTGKYR